MKKHHREFLKGLHAMMPTAEVALVPVSGGHPKFSITYGGKVKTILVSGTPKRPEHCVLNALKDVARMFDLKDKP